MKLTPGQEDAAQSAYLNSIQEITSGLNEAQQARIAETLKDMQHADLPAKCDAMIVMISAAARMPGITGDWYRRKFIELAGE